ncbi:MAG: hypothetical protein VXZ43_08160 [Pseudomonadota bacterium]|nr:hypothetical protein [Pseudomonadota bacterium]
MGSPLSILLEALTYGAMALLAWKGRTPERLVLAGLLALQFCSPILDHLMIGSFRWAVAGLSLGMFALLTGLALVYERWWLLLAAGAQLIALSTHFAALSASHPLMWSMVSARMVVWFELLLLAIFGVWEANAAPYARNRSRREHGALPL